MTYKISDHFDGKKFFNPHARHEPTFAEMLKLATHLRFQKWPKWIENRHQLNLHPPLTDDQVAITFVNHATVLIQLPGLNILTDPVWALRASPLSWLGPKRVRAPGIEFDQLPPIDLVLVSHNHYDHMDVATLQKLRKKFSPIFLVALGDEKLMHWHGIENVTEMDWWDQRKISDSLEVIYAPTQHFSSRSLFDRNQSLWGSFVLRYRGHQIYFGGDAGYSAHYKEISQRLGPMALSLLPIGAYEPRWFMKTIHMNPEEAVQAHLDLQSKFSIGIHFGTFQLTEESIDAPTEGLKVALAQRSLDANTFITLSEGVTDIYQLNLR